MPLTVGDRLGHYDVTALIGEGGMGQMYRARDTKLDRDVALKVLQYGPYLMAYWKPTRHHQASELATQRWTLDPEGR